MDGGAWKGWNIKYKKSSKSICTLYPKEGYLQILLAIGAREMNEAELLMPSCTEYTQGLFEVKEVNGAKYLGFEVRDDNVLQDVKNLADIRVKRSEHEIPLRRFQNNPLPKERNEPLPWLHAQLHLL